MPSQPVFVLPAPMPYSRTGLDGVYLCPKCKRPCNIFVNSKKTPRDNTEHVAKSTCCAKVVVQWKTMGPKGW